MRTIWKYPLDLNYQSQTIEMPKGAKILSAQTQGDSICLWVLVESVLPLEKRGIAIFGTGHRIPDVWGEIKFIDTIQMENGRLIFHVFEIPLIVDEKLEGSK